MKPEVCLDLSEKEIELLEEFKTRVAAEHGDEAASDEFHLRRFLRAREFDVQKAEIMIRNHISWRKKSNIENILQEGSICEIVSKYFPLSKIGRKKYEHLTILVHFGNTDSKGLIMSTKRSTFIRFLEKSVEEDVQTLNQKSKEEGREVEKWTYILDFENFTLAQATFKEGIELLLHFLSIYEANYPERLETAYIINASIYFTVLFSVVKPLLSGATLQKVVILDKKDYKEHLGKLMPLDELPAYLGGNKTDPDGDPRCHSIINHGSAVPKSFYLSKVDRSLATEQDCKQYFVQRLSKMSIKVEVDEAGSQIEWQFETLNRDIGFGVHYSDPKVSRNKPEEVLPVQRVDTRFLVEVGMYVCHRPGIYALIFDNSFSWLRSKELLCRAYLVTPLGQRTCVTN